MFATTFAFQLRSARSNPVAFTLVALSALGALFVGYHHDAMTQAIAYLIAMWLCSFVIDLYALHRPAGEALPVRNPKRETIYFLVCTAIGSVALILRFDVFLDWTQLGLLPRLAVALPLILFAFPIVLAAMFLIQKYKPRDLGLRLHGVLLAVPVIALCALTNRLVCPQSLTWNNIQAEGGSLLNILLLAFISAGLSEEFFRVIGQTRLGAFFQNAGVAWFITTVIWGLMHAPKWYADGHDLTEALLGSLRIIPLGLMWGYITHRTKSFLPAVIVHGMNVWGLQNF